MNSVSILKFILLACAALVLTIYFQYPTFAWPIGLEALECLISFIFLLTSAFFISKFKTKLSNLPQQKNVILGLYIGLLWTIEISINNIIGPGLPLRDIIDNIFWGIIACLILYLAIRDSFQSKNIFNGLKSGFLTGLTSGAIACITALILIVFGMPLILKDKLNIKEWFDVQKNEHYSSMPVYFAYQTMAGAIMHLVILGAIMGIFLGLIGGLVGKLLSFRKVTVGQISI